MHWIRCTALLLEKVASNVAGEFSCRHGMQTLLTLASSVAFGCNKAMFAEVHYAVTSCSILEQVRKAQATPTVSDLRCKVWYIFDSIPKELCRVAQHYTLLTPKSDQTQRVLEIDIGL
jgi:hypothetical protein